MEQLMVHLESLVEVIFSGIILTIFWVVFLHTFEVQDALFTELNSAIMTIEIANQKEWNVICLEYDSKGN
ncbi:hypothetical protein Lalb_Chr13g0290911 [Lupinus albus]|uniref:Uncharacterized protein n=1 Tax=Lupinus albus TaxID=3870 RepID=A0A6A4PH52_LUPAL|nr:hypothetical protein Lalb_Chr13g0290911 [Lupinus albus]